MNAGASLSAVPSPIEGSGTAWVLLGSWALSPARPTPIPPRHECRGFSALLVIIRVLRPQGAHELFGHAFGGYAQASITASATFGYQAWWIGAPNTSSSVI